MANLMLVQCMIASHGEVWTISVLVEILSGVDSDHATGPRRDGSHQLKVHIMSNIKVMLTKDAPLSSRLEIGQFLLDFASLKILLDCSTLCGCDRQISN